MTTQRQTDLMDGRLRQAGALRSIAENIRTDDPDLAGVVLDAANIIDNLVAELRSVLHYRNSGCTCPDYPHRESSTCWPHGEF